MFDIYTEIEKELMSNLFYHYQLSESNLSFHEWILTKQTTNMKIKAVIIDPYEMAIKETEIDNKLEAYYEAIGYGCELIEVFNIDNFTDLIIDEEGLFEGHAEDDNGDKKGFILRGYKKPLFGKAIVVGRKGENFISTNLNRDGVYNMLGGWITSINN